ncbi:MAG: hypothetical protein L6Q92_14370 [Phycisphaerae bacterium]|nr:hypothetical protein [Phycisphaerae bacterium]
MNELLGAAEMVTRIVLAWLGPALAYGSALAALTWVGLALVGRRIRAALHGALWLVVLIKFLVPVGPSWSYSIASLLVRIGAPAAAPTGGGVERVTVESLSWMDAGSSGGIASTSSRAASRPTLWTLVAAVYVLGVVYLAVSRMAAYAAFARGARRLPGAGESIRVIVLDVCRRLGVRRVPAVRISPDAPAPFVFGVFRPTLILSARQLVRPDELEAVVLHEVAHLRRGDLIVRYVQWIAGTLLFFWPVVAWVNRRIDLARELACDDWALRHSRLSAGEYARCLLRAVHPVMSRRAMYRPAAMAANVTTVERRIEMILNGRNSMARFGSLGLPALVLVLAWSVFALSGAATAGEGPPVCAAGGEDQVRVEVQVAGDGAEPRDEDVQLWVKKLDGPAGDRLFELKLPTREELAQFLTAHPTADADGNGTLSRAEYNAYFAARALSNPAAVLQQYPDADADHDGVLSANEAAHFVGGGMIIMEATECVEGAEGASEKTVQKRVAVFKMRMHEDGAAPAELPPPPPDTAAIRDWILQNIAAEPTAADVAAQVRVLEELPNAMMLKHHPEADTDGDGRLSREERRAMMRVDRLNARSMLLKHFPNADANGDGQLSDGEMDALAKNHNGVFVRRLKKGDQDCEFRVEGSTESGKKIVIVEEKKTTESGTADSGNQ